MRVFSLDRILADEIHIPLYIPVDVVVAEGLVHGTPASFSLFCGTVQKFVGQVISKEVQFSTGSIFFVIL